MSSLYVDHLVAAFVTFALLVILERIIHRDEPNHTLIELFIIALGITITIALTLGMIALTYLILLVRKQPNALSRASYWPVELVRLVTRRKRPGRQYLS